MSVTVRARSKPKPWVRKLRKALQPTNLFANISLILICAMCLLPIIWTASSSLKERDELFQTYPSLLPRRPSLGNYRWLFTRRDLSMLPLNTLNSLKVSLGAVALQTVLATMAGYGFARLEFKGRDLLFYSLIMLMFVPRAGGLMALYELMDFLHLRNSHLGLVLLFPSAISVALFIMRQTFLAIPKELEESAVIDGANTWQVFLKVALPMATGGVTVVAIFEFVYTWGEYLITLTMLDFRELETLSIAIAKIRGWSALFTSGAYCSYGTENAAYMVAMMPVIIVFILMQRWFVRGLTEGILKF